MHGHDHLLARRGELERALAELAGDSPWAKVIGALRCLRGIDTLSATGLCAEVGEFGRFAHPKLLSSHLGLVGSEHSSGERRRLGSITKAGPKHARRLLVEAAWHYRRAPRVSAALARRQQGQDARAIGIAWRCQRRLYRRWQRLEGERGKRSTIVAVAVARELATFCWETGRSTEPTSPPRLPGRHGTEATSRPPRSATGLWPAAGMAAAPAPRRPTRDEETVLG